MKRECLVANLFKPDIAQLYDIDPEQNLINTIRVLCTKYPESFRFFVPEELFPDIRNGAIIPVSAEIFDCVPGNHFPIDPLKVLSEQIREYEKKYDRILDKMEIRLYVEGYELPSPKMAMVTLSKTVPAIEKNELMVSGSKDLAVNDVDAQPEVTTDMNLQTYKNQSRSEQFETGRGSEEGYANLQSGSNNTCSSEPSRPMKDGDDQHRDASGKTQTASGEPSGSKSRGEPSGKKLPVGAFVIAGILLAAIIAAVLFFTRDTSVRRFEQAMTDADYQTAVMAEELNMNLVTAAMNGGEDYELLFTVPLTDHEKVAQMKTARIIGRITKPELGTMMVTRDDAEIAIQAQGWNAFNK